MPFGVVTRICRQCSIVFRDPYRFSEHMKVKKYFLYAFNHLLQEHVPSPAACRFCSGVTTDEEYEQHKANHPTDFICSICLLRYKNVGTNCFFLILIFRN